ncbi:MAG: SNF2-related protein, partial [Candidatus Magasanikbacteria bacterium]|nr:SNF2-related protein [Candidatus Magasanikbacteria bacterium]
VEKSKELEDRLKKDLSKDEQEKDGLSQNIRSLIGVFGASRAIDLLYKFRPEFRGIPVERVKSCLGEYLGDFLAAKHEFHLKDLGEAKEFLSDTTFREGLYETMKSHCLQYYFQERKKGVEGDSYEIIYGYLVHIIDELGDDTNEFLDQVIEDVVTYFADAIQKFHKPEKFVDHLAEGREFPDLNQKINMKELQDKKRMLIADEMGLGKSASVIMAKEHMKLGCAVVVVPAVVVGTWQDYLSDDPERKGYFKPGQAPRVLVVENPEQLRDVTKDQYDYIIVSHGRLNGRYAPLLEQLDPDMLIVDEVHELKNIKAGKKAAVRSRALMPLVRKLEQGEKENKYLAILSGTPIPNKVRDVALTLKMLYPEKFADMSSAELVRDIIHGDAINLRALLIPHMQMKELEDVVEMPERAEKIVEVKLSPDEADMYEAILELDELTATEKMKTLMKFLMNPALLDTTPGIEGAKIVALRNELQEIFKTKSKVLLLVNHLISGILRGRNAVIDQLSLPPNVKIETIHGEDDKKQRPKIQNEFNNGVDPMLLGGSGDAMGVGISLVGGEVTIVYSEPWTESDLRQQKARVFRPGLQHPIQERTMIVSGTLDEGIHKYIARKYAAVEKILKGIPISELDKRMLEKAESNPTGEDADFELNPELARTYYSWRQRLSQMFGHMKELGEESIVKFLETWGADYAEGYRQVGARSYQANTNRVSGTLINEMIQKSGRHPAALAILDVASGPEMLRHHIGNANQESVFSLDINGHHFKDSTSGKTRTGSWTKMPIKSGSVDYLNCAMAFQDSAFIPSKGKFERIDVLREMNRVLKNGGRAVISMIYSMQMLDMEKFKLFAEATGFHLVEDYSGLAENGGRFSSQIITLEKFADAQKTAQDIFKEVGQENHSGLKMGNTEKILKNYREILTGFFLDGRAKTVDLNDSDRAVLHEEKELTDKVAELKVRYKTIRDIPPEEVISNGFVRMLAGKNYLLFKRLTKASGVVILT